MSSACLTYHDYDHGFTFLWDGESPEIEVHSGGLVHHTTEMIPLQGTPFDTSFIGMLRWFESICDSYVRNLDQEVTDAETPTSEGSER